MKKKENKEMVKCNDVHCPIHGRLSTRGRIFVGKVTKLSSNKTISIEWVRNHYIIKYERYEKRRSRLKVHKPDCIDVKVGDNVRVMETRPISKMKHAVILEVLK